MATYKQSLRENAIDVGYLCQVCGRLTSTSFDKIKADMSDYTGNNTEESTKRNLTAKNIISIADMMFDAPMKCKCCGTNMVAMDYGIAKMLSNFVKKDFPIVTANPGEYKAGNCELPCVVLGYNPFSIYLKASLTDTIAARHKFRESAEQMYDELIRRKNDIADNEFGDIIIEMCEQIPYDPRIIIRLPEPENAKNLSEKDYDNLCNGFFMLVRKLGEDLASIETFDMAPYIWNSDRDTAGIPYILEIHKDMTNNKFTPAPAAVLPEISDEGEGDADQFTANRLRRMYANELEDTRVAMSNERLWEKGSAEEEAKMHHANLSRLMRHEEVLLKMLKELDAEEKR